MVAAEGPWIPAFRHFDFPLFPSLKLHDTTQISLMVAYVREMTVRKSCEYSVYGLFEHLLFLFVSFFSPSSFPLGSNQLFAKGIICVSFFSMN